MKNPFTIRNMPYIAILAAIEIVLQYIGNAIAFGPISINLSLVPIALGAIIFGPWVGLFLGIINSLFVLMAPSTMIFYNVSVVGTIITVFIKSGAAGFFGGLIYLLINKRNNLLATIVTSISIPLINTGLFIVGSLTFFRSFLESNSTNFNNIYEFLFIGMIGWNFIFEITTSIVLIYPIYRIILYYQNKHQVVEAWYKERLT